MRWTATDETGWVADLDSAAATVWKLRYADTADMLEGRQLRHLMGDLWALLDATSARLEVILAERRRLREEVAR